MGSALKPTSLPLSRFHSNGRALAQRPMTVAFAAAGGQATASRSRRATVSIQAQLLPLFVEVALTFVLLYGMAYLRTEAGVILHYLRLSFWPDPLILDYSWPISSSWSASLPARRRQAAPC